MNKEFWNNRYKTNETVYGHSPNTFFKEQLLALQHGRLLLPAEGEGRNALFAAQSGWEVTAFDYSKEAMKKALNAAAKCNVKIDYTVNNLTDVKLVPHAFDAIGLIYVHMEPPLRKAFHQKCMEALKPGGTLLLEAFSKEQINNQSGGPKELHLLYSLEELLDDFDGLRIGLCKSEDVFLDEGSFHAGIADVVRIVAKKNAIT